MLLRMDEIEIRPVRTNAEYRGVAAACGSPYCPYERCPSVAELRDAGRSRSGCCCWPSSTARSSVTGCRTVRGESGRASVVPRVRPEFRRRGVGTGDAPGALTEHAVTQGATQWRAALSTTTDRWLFARRFGFTESNRQVEQLRRIGAEPWPEAPADYRIMAVAERPELWAEGVRAGGLWRPSRTWICRRPWTSRPTSGRPELINDPAAMFLAVVGDDVIGVAGLMLDTEPAQPGGGRVTPPYARSGVARASRPRSSARAWAWAAEHGITEIYTWTQRGNEEHAPAATSTWASPTDS